MLVLVERNIFVCKTTFCKEEKFFFLIINLLWNENAIYVRGKELTLYIWNYTRIR